MPPSEQPRASRSRRRRIPPPRPSAQNAAAYVSQGRAVAHVAHQQRVIARARRATRNAAPLSPRTPAQARRSLGFNAGQGDLRPAQRAAAQRAQRAQQHVAPRPMPHVPILRNPTRAQAQAAHDLIAAAINRQVPNRTFGVSPTQARNQILRDIQTDPRLRQVRAASSHYARALERRNAITIARGGQPTQEDVAASLRQIAGQTKGVRPLSARPVTPSFAGTRAENFAGLAEAAAGYGSKDAGGLALSRRSQEIRAGRAKSRLARAMNRYEALAPPKARHIGIGPAQVNITPAATKLGGAAAAALAQTSLNVGDLGPRNLAAKIGRDAGTVATGPFVGGYEIGKGAADVAIGAATQDAAQANRGLDRLGSLAAGVGEATANTFIHPARSFSENPLLSALTFLGAEGAIGRTAGAAARAAGSTVESAGLRGSLARIGSEVRPPISYSADAARAGLKERRYSRNLIHKAVQVANDSRREVLTHPDGSPVTVVRQGREVPVLAPRGRGVGSTGEISRMGRHQANFIAGRQQASEYATRDKAGHEFTIARARGEFKGIKGQHARDAVAMVAEGTITSEKHFLTDLHAYRSMVQREIQRHEVLGEKVFHSKSELRDAKAQVKRIDTMLEDKRLHAQIPKIVAAGTEIGRRLVHHEKYAQLGGAMDPIQADRARLIHPAVLHMGAKHFTVDELRAMDEPRVKAARERVTVERERYNTIARDITRLEHERARAGGRQQVHSGQAKEPLRVYRVGDREFDTRAKADAYVKKNGGVVRVLAKTIPESKRMGELSRLDRAIANRRKDLAAARATVRDARRKAHDARRTRPDHGALRHPDGRFLSTRDIEETLRSKGRDPGTVAYLPPGAVGRSAFHRRFSLNRPVIGGAGHTRTGEQFRRGLTTATAKNVREQGVRLAVTTQKVHGIDRTISEHGMTRPDGRYFTFKEGEEYSKRLKDDTGEDLIPVRAVPARANASMDRLARGRQSPTSMENLSQRLFNDRLSPDTQTGARNVVLMPAAIVNQLARHAQSTHEIVKLFQWINKPFRAAVLPTFRWLSGNFVEPFVVRLGAVGSGVNVAGLAVDLRASSQIVKAGLRSADPNIKRAAEEMAAQLGMGMFVGGRGASVRRTLEELPGHEAWGPVVAKFPVVHQTLEMTRTLLKGFMAPANAFFGLNRVIENTANRAAFGHIARADIRSVQGSWTKSLLLGQKAAEEASRGLLNTSTQRRYADSMHELLGKYTGFSPTSRALFQTILPFVPWFLNSARFVFWTLPAHHPVKSALLQQTAAQVQQDWQDIHKDTPPGSLRYAIPNGKGGWIDLARYTPFGAFTEAAGGGGFSAFTGQILPQIAGAQKALEGKDPFGRDLSAPPGETPNEGAVALNSLAEALVPYLATTRRLREGGATGYSTSTVLDPKTKPGTKHTSAVLRTFSPINPTYLRGPTGASAPATPQDERVLRRAQRSAARSGGSAEASQRALRRARAAAGGG